MNGTRQSALVTRRAFRDLNVCTSCRKTLHQRHYALAAAQVAHVPAPSLDQVPPVTQASAPRLSYKTHAGVVLARPPQITRDLTPFERAYFFYQRRLNERLALPFTRYFYFKKGTPADLEWKRKQKDRQTAARDIGVYNAYSKEGWNDELLVGSKESDPEHQAEALLSDAEAPGIGSEEMGEPKRETIERPMPRITEADRTNDLRRLDRKLDRTIYLLVQEETGRWRFPASGLAGKESLHQAAERTLVQGGGLNMNTWVIGNAPIGHYKFNYPKPRLIAEKAAQEFGEITFYMKARIMTGQPNLQENRLGLVDFKWLSKDEVRGAVTVQYWAAVKNMLADR
ncbi:MAG: 54S ribosomal protein L17 mitochondrial [Piccolia ochrophora]|nr:MAG: 54S ribosomal protein L17 mitochondrial [Piccolia ochrophora]